MQKVTDNVYVETGYQGCNVTFFVTAGGVVMVDTPQMPTDAIKWRDEIAKHGEVKYLINSEPHGDHTTGNYFFGGINVAHEGVREAILASSVEQLKERMQNMPPEDARLFEDFSYRAPTITFSKNLTLYVGDHTFRLMNLPGHTEYQTAIYCPEEKVICTSDNVITESSPLMFAAVPYEWLESVKTMQGLDADWLVPGHGEVCKPDYLEVVGKGVRSWIDLTKDAMSQGLSLEEAINDTSLLDKYSIEIGGGLMADRLPAMNLTRLYEVLGE